jgi:acetyltransferase-like isoleucine patch superfamily enzyme
MSFLERFYLRLQSLFSYLLFYPVLRLLGVDCNNTLTLIGMPIISRFTGSQIKIGQRVVLCSLSNATALGVNHPVTLRTLARESTIEIGDDVGISGGSICAGRYVKIGNRSMLGANVTIADTDFHDISSRNRRYAGIPDDSLFAPIIIEENVFIGTNTIILKGVTIGANSVIGAGSVVTHNIPENVIAAGNPCKIIKSLQ